MSKLRKVPPCKLIVTKTFNENSNLITMSEDVLDSTVSAIRHGDSAAKAANFLLSQLKDVKYNIEQENLDPRGVYIGSVRGKKAIDLLNYLNRNFNLSKEIKRDLDFVITSIGDFFKISKSKLRELKKEAENYVSPEERREVNKNKDLICYLAYELSYNPNPELLRELLLSVWIGSIPIIKEHKEQIGQRAFDKTIFGQKGILSLELLAINPYILDCKNLSYLLDKLPIYLVAKLFRGLSLTINKDSTVIVFCQGREEYHLVNDQGEYIHPYGGNPHFLEEHNIWFEENRSKPFSIRDRISWEDEKESILSQYSDEILYPSRKTDYFMISLKDKEIKELCYNTNTLEGSWK